MSELANDTTKKNPLSALNQARLFAVGLLVGAPLSYLLLAYEKSGWRAAPGNAGTFLYLLLVLAVICPGTYWIVEKATMEKYRQSPVKSGEEADKVFITTTVIRLTMAGAVFIYGLVVFFISRDIKPMLYYFYPIGAVWAFIHWPRASHYERIRNLAQGRNDE